jgi:hypothetical protein
MSAVGGFFELETSCGSGHLWHPDSVALTSGRAGLRAILELARPARVLVPFYICDAALEPLRLLGIPFEFYSLTPTLDPVDEGWPADAGVLYVNYFGMKAAGADRLAALLGSRVVVDDTQAFFRRGRGSCWSFNSARKFFGVPDGAYVYGPRACDIRPAPPNDAAPAAHLSSRLAGDQELAYQQFLTAEAQVSVDVRLPSRAASRLLEGIRYEEARTARRRNFTQLHERLAGVNALAMDLTLDADAAPFCYPFLPSRRALHQALWQRQIFVPRLWPEVVSRPGGPFVWERDLAARLLPLPVDHRYGHDDMTRVMDAVLDVAA